MSVEQIEDLNNEVAGVEIIAEKPVLERPDDEEEFDSNDPRAAIYAKRDAQVKAEMQAETATTPVAQAAEAAPETKSDEVTVIINGKEKLVSQARIDAAGGIVAYQKQAAASELLNQASAEARRIKEKEAQILERERQLEMQEQQIQQRKQEFNPVPSVNTDALSVAKEYHEAILDGDMDKASLLLIKMQTAQPATVNKDEVATEAVRRARQELEAEKVRQEQERFEADRREANEDFEARFPLVADDPKLRALANQETIALLEAHPTWTPKEIITAAAQSVQKWATERLAISSTDQKLAAKRGQNNIRGATVIAAQRQAPPPQTKSNYVEQLRKARGLE